MVEVRTPDRRECVRCGRLERWDEELQTWQVADDEVGDPYCIHTWDITGEFTPIAE
jgi:hypothetical protein